MDNYYYIVASLPEISRDCDFHDGTPDSIIEDIRSQCYGKDAGYLDLLLEGLDAENLCEDFYRKAFKCGNKFIRDYFQFDMMLRNAKVKYLNERLGRDADKDMLILRDGNGEAEESVSYDETDAINAVLRNSDLLEREKKLDKIVWDRVSLITTFDYFNINTVLGFVCKLNTVSRWFRLNEDTGKALFRKMVNEVLDTFKGVDYKG